MRMIAVCLCACIIVMTGATNVSSLVGTHCSTRGGCGCDCSWAKPSSCLKDDGSCCFACCCSPSPSPPPSPPSPPPPSSGHHQGPITIKEDGKIQNLHVVALTADLVTSHDSGSSIAMKWGGETRAFVVKDPIDDMTEGNYYNFTLLNKELSYDVDISTVGCSCNAALFFVSLPGYNSDGSVAHGSYNPYYCDANDVGGVWCWEHDTLESNKYTMTTTPHKCSSPAGGYISSCDKGGCGTNAYKVDNNGMCPDSHCKIDTRSPFRINQAYEVDKVSKKLSQITNKLVQGNSTFEWTACNDASYLEEMTNAMRSDMKMVFQLWGTTNSGMSWLDGVTGCSGDCNKDTAMVTFSNIEINSLNMPPSSPSPPPTPSPPAPAPAIV